MSEIAAFPHKPERREQVGTDLYSVIPGDSPGMSLRDYFAAKAMQALLETAYDGPCDGCAIDAYDMADAMLKARAQSTTTVGMEG